MKASKKGTSWGPKRTARLAAGLAIVAITAAGIGAASSGASAANAGARTSGTIAVIVAPTTTAAPTTTVAPSKTPTATIKMYAVGWG